MKPNASLVIKNRENKITANICIGGHSVACSGPSASLPTALDRVFSQCRLPADIANVLIAVDFTRFKLPLEKKFPNMLYIQIHPTSGSQTEPAAVSGSEGGIADKVRNFLLWYDFHKGFLNLDMLVDLIEGSDIQYAAINSPYTITEYNIESILHDLLSDKYPHIAVYPTRHLMNRDFISRGNTLLLNLIARRYIEQYILKAKEFLKGYGVRCPLFFLRSNGGFVGESTIRYEGFDTYRCEELAWLFDVISLYAEETLYIADWNAGNLYFVRKGAPQMIRMPVDYHGIKINANIPVHYSLQDIRSPQQFLDLLNAHNPFPGPVPVVLAGSAPFETGRLFDYPPILMNSPKALYPRSMEEPVYLLEMEAYEERKNIPGAKNQLLQELHLLAEKDGLLPEAARCTFEHLPIKYLTDGKNIVRATYKIPLGARYAADP
jgi:hypothetical protein